MAKLTKNLQKNYLCQKFDRFRAYLFPQVSLARLHLKSSLFLARVIKFRE